MNKLTLIIGTLLAGLALIGYAIFVKVSDSEVAPSTFAEDERVNQILQTDWDNLKNEKAAEHRVHGALTRLAQLKGDEETLQMVLKKQESSSVLVRKGVAEALGYFSQPQSEDHLLKMLEDPELDVRAAAIKALGQKKSDVRKQALLDLYARVDDLHDKEKTALYSSLIKQIERVSGKEKMVDSILSILESSEEPQVLREAADVLVKIAPGSSKAQKFFEKTIQKGKDTELGQKGIYFLASVKSNWIKENIEELVFSDEELFRVAAIQSLSQVCPANRYELIKKSLIKEESKVVLDIILQSVQMMRDEKMMQTIGELSQTQLSEYAYTTQQNLLNPELEQTARNLCAQN